jgi:hypothetical protein
MNVTIHNLETGEVLDLDIFTANEKIARDPAWSREPPLPAGWDREMPLYQATRDLVPAALERMRLDTPWTSSSNPNVWQYADRPIAAGEEVETTAWPHDSFLPLNHSARAIHEFFTTRTKSRMQQSPWTARRIHLEDGLSGKLPQGRLNSRRGAAA